jgi:hypothetical protein
MLPCNQPHPGVRRPYAEEDANAALSQMLDVIDTKVGGGHSSYLVGTFFFHHVIFAKSKQQLNDDGQCGSERVCNQPTVGLGFRV